MHTTKVEQASTRVEQLREQIRGEVAGDAKRAERRARVRRVLVRGLGCLGLQFLWLAFVIGVSAYLIARTGLVTVPVLSPMVRHERQPVRVVAPASLGAVEGRIAASIARSLAADAGAERSLALTESELSALLRSMLRDAGGDAASVAATAQVAIEGPTIELFARVPRSGAPGSTLLIRGVPTIRDGRLTVIVRDAAVGNLGMPKRIVAWALNGALRDVPLTITTGGGAPRVAITSLAFDDRALRITFRPTP